MSVPLVAFGIVVERSSFTRSSVASSEGAEPEITV
jgi:hypothetical protein